MPNCIPIRDLKNTGEISQLCHQTGEPIYVTKNGYRDLVIMSGETLCNPDAAAKLIEAVEQSYVRLEQNPKLYSLCVQPILRAAGYRKVVIGRYILIYRVDDARGAVYIERFFSELEDYAEKL